MRRFVLGDPQAPFAAVMKVLAPICEYGRLRDDVQLISIGDHFDYDLTDPKASRIEGLATLRWLASHPGDQVRLLIGNHDAARVVELASVSDVEFAAAQKLAWSIEATKRAHGRAAAKQRERDELHVRFPQLSTAAIIARDYASFSEEQRALVVELMLAGRFDLGIASALLDGRSVLITHAAVTTHETVESDPAVIAAELQRMLTDALEARRADWQRGTITPLSLEPWSQAGIPGQEAGGLLAHRPSNPDRPGADPKWERDPTRRRRFAPSELARGLTQVCGHTNHPHCVKELVGWVTPRAKATRYAGIRTLHCGNATTYDLGVHPPEAGAADLILVDGELRDPNNRAELLEVVPL